MIKQLIIWSLICGVFGGLYSQPPGDDHNNHTTTVDSLLRAIYSLNQYRPEGYQKGMAEAFCQIGKITYAQGESEGAFSLLQKSLSYAEQATAYRTKGNIHLELCQYYLDQDNLQQAMEEAEQAEKAFQQVDDQYSIKKTQAFKGLIFYEKQNYDLALSLLWEGLDRDEKGIFCDPALDAALKLEKPNKALEIIGKVGPFSLTQLQENLTEREALIGYYLGDEQAYAYVLTAEKKELVNLGKTAEIERVLTNYQSKYIEKVRENTIAFKQKGVRKHFFQLSSWLYDLLWVPVEKTKLIKNKSLIVIPDGVLNKFPFETLIKDKRSKPFHRYHYLIHDYEVSYYPEFIFLPRQAHPELVEKYQTYLIDSPNSQIEALRKARLKMIKSKSEYANPWYWAIYKNKQ